MTGKRQNPCCGEKITDREPEDERKVADWLPVKGQPWARTSLPLARSLIPRLCPQPQRNNFPKAEQNSSFTRASNPGLAQSRQDLQIIISFPWPLSKHLLAREQQKLSVSMIKSLLFLSGLRGHSCGYDCVLTFSRGRALGISAVLFTLRSSWYTTSGNQNPGLKSKWRLLVLLLGQDSKISFLICDI